MNSPEINELAAALVAAQAEFGAVPKGATNPFFKSKYASLPDVVQHASPILAKHGLAISQHVTYDETGRDALMTYLLHKSGQYIAYSMKLHLVKEDPQAQGSAITYARRYSYQAVLGLVTDEDDDGQRATQAQSRVIKKAPELTPSQEQLKNALAKKFKEASERKTWVESVVFHDIAGISALTEEEVQLCNDQLALEEAKK
jgi:ERF superfamily